jgi:hypothetical protein
MREREEACRLMLAADTNRDDWGDDEEDGEEEADTDCDGQPLEQAGQSG